MWEKVWECFWRKRGNSHIHSGFCKLFESPHHFKIRAGASQHEGKETYDASEAATGQETETAPVGLQLAIEMGPKFYGHCTLAQGLNLPRTSKTLARKERWTAFQDQLTDASACSVAKREFPIGRVSAPITRRWA